MQDEEDELDDGEVLGCQRVEHDGKHDGGDAEKGAVPLLRLVILVIEAYERLDDCTG